MPQAGESPATTTHAATLRGAGATLGRGQTPVQHGRRASQAGEEPAAPYPGSAPDARWQTEHRAGTAPQSASLLAQLDALQARVDALLASRVLARDGGAGLEIACVGYGVATYRFDGREVTGRCRPGPNVGVYRVSSTRKAERAAEVRGGSLFQDTVDGPGAVAVEDGRRAGAALVDGGAL